MRIHYFALGALTLATTGCGMEPLPAFCDVPDYQVSSAAALEELSACRAVTGSLSIVDTDVSNLSGLEGLRSVGGDLVVHNTALTSLRGLDNLNNVGGQLHISGNDSLTNLHGLDNLTSIGGLAGSDNYVSVGKPL